MTASSPSFTSLVSTAPTDRNLPAGRPTDSTIVPQGRRRSRAMLMAALAVSGVATTGAGNGSTPGSAVVAGTCCAVVELRQYTLHPGQRDVLIDMFNRRFIEPQEELGIRVIAQFRDLDNPDRFVWLRGFSDMQTRADALHGFYFGPLWKAHRVAANATIIDNDNVLLLRPSIAGGGFALPAQARVPVDNIDIPRGFVAATVYSFDAPVDAAFLDFFHHRLQPLQQQHGAALLGDFVSENSPNTFPQLPVREGEHVLVAFSLFDDEAAYARYLAALQNSPEWQTHIAGRLNQALSKPPQTLRLAPAARSQIHA